MTAAEASLPSDLELRPLAPRDAAAVAELIFACDLTYSDWAPSSWSPPPEHEERAKWEERLGEPDRWAGGAWDGQGALVGMVSMRQARDDGGEPIAGVGHIGAVFVHPSRWRQRIASALIGAAEREMGRWGFGRARLRSPEGGPAERFYEATGWRLAGGRCYRDDVGLWMVIYEKQLSVP